MRSIYDTSLNKETYSDFPKQEYEHKKAILDYLRGGKLTSIGGIVIDFSTDTWTYIENLEYESGEYYWDTSDIYHFEKYDLKLNDDFVQYVLEQTK